MYKCNSSTDYYCHLLAFANKISKLGYLVEMKKMEEMGKMGKMGKW